MTATKTEITLTNLGFTAEESRTIFTIGVTSFYARDAIVLHNSYGSELLYIILEGRVNALAIDSEGQETLSAHYGTGEFFGGKAFADVPYATSIKTVEPCRFLVLRVRDWLKQSNKKERSPKSFVLYSNHLLI